MDSDNTRSPSGSLADCASSRASHQSDLFDYQALEPAARAVALEAAAKIKLHGRRAAESIVAIGEELARVKAALPHGAWLPWLGAEFGWSEDTAGRFLQVARLKADIPQIAEYPIDVSALYLLARPSTPEPVREAALERAAAGERVSHGYVRDLVDETRERLREAFPSRERLDSEATWTPDLTETVKGPQPAYDPEKRRAFDLEAELGGCIHTFTILKADPREVARAVHPVTRRRQLEDAQRVVMWLQAMIRELESLHHVA